MRFPILSASALACVLLFIYPAYAENTLSLEDAVTIALNRDDPRIAGYRERAAALDDRAIADSQLPDPNLRLRLQNLPTDSFKFSQEPMTQAEVALQQAFPAGETRSLTREKRGAEAQAARAHQSLELSGLILDTRHAWFEVYYWAHARETLAKSREAIRELSEVLTGTFATGRKTSQDVLRAQLELSLLDDRLMEAERQEHMARASLARFVGSASSQESLPTQLPALQEPPRKAALRDALAVHPAIKAEDAEIAARTYDIEIAEEQYKPHWMVDVGYGVRSGQRPDFASVGVTLSLPFFTDKRQDRNASAARHERNAARLDRHARLLEMNKLLGRTYAAWDMLNQRIALYERAVLERAAGTTEAALSAYRNAVSDFDDLIQARLAELEAELTLLRLRVDRAQAQAQLLYLNGEHDE
jgi:outer membrane protein TolC